jgi:hypothetical protein
MKLQELYENDYQIEDKYETASIKKICGDNVDFNAVNSALDKIFKFKKISSLEGCPDQLEMLSISGDKNQLTNLKGMPKVITERCFLTDGKQLNSFEGAEGVSVKSLLSFTGCKFESLHNIHKAFSSVNRLSFISNPIQSHVLGLLKIKNLVAVQFMTTSEYQSQITVWDDQPRWDAKHFAKLSLVAKLSKVQQIIESHLGKNDVLSAQQELIDMGLDEYAQL